MGSTLPTQLLWHVPVAGRSATSQTGHPAPPAVPSADSRTLYVCACLVVCVCVCVCMCVCVCVCVCAYGRVSLSASAKGGSRAAGRHRHGRRSGGRRGPPPADAAWRGCGPRPACRACAWAPVGPHGSAAPPPPGHTASHLRRPTHTRCPRSVSRWARGRGSAARGRTGWVGAGRPGVEAQLEVRGDHGPRRLCPLKRLQRAHGHQPRPRGHESHPCRRVCRGRGRGRRRALGADGAGHGRRGEQGWQRQRQRLCTHKGRLRRHKLRPPRTEPARARRRRPRHRPRHRPPRPVRGHFLPRWGR
jgi:hypothetical protein